MTPGADEFHWSDSDGWNSPPTTASTGTLPAITSTGTMPALSAADDAPATATTGSIPPISTNRRWIGSHRRRPPNAKILLTVLAACIALVAATAVVTHLTGGLIAQSVEVRAADSTYVVQEEPTTNFGDRQTVQAAALTNEHAVVYLKFVVPKFASSISAVRLDLRAAGITSERLSLHRVSNNGWNGDATSYSNRPQIGKIVATAPGPAAVGAVVSFDLTNVVKGPGTYSFAVSNASTQSVFAAYGWAQGTRAPALHVAYQSRQTGPGRSYARAMQSAQPIRGGNPAPTGSANPGPIAGPTANPGPPGGGPAPVIPSGPTLCGAYFDSSNGSYMAGLSVEQGKVGTLKSVRVFNTGAPKAWPGNAGNLDRTVIVSFKFAPQDVIAGKEDSLMKSWFANAPRDRNVYWSYFHEPEDQIRDGAFTAAQYREAWTHLASLADAANNPRLISTLILMQWTLMKGSGRNWQDYYAGSGVIDAFGWDVYNGNSANDNGTYNSPASLMDPILAVQKQTGKPYGVAELGAKRASSDTSGSGRAAWLAGIVSIMRNSGALWAEYFDTDKSNVGRYDWRLTDAASQAAWRSFCNS
jgi:hypothetical protein